MWECGGFEKLRILFGGGGGPHNLDSSILGSILGSPYLENYHIGLYSKTASIFHSLARGAPDGI